MIICGLHFDKTLRTNYEKCDQKRLWSVILKDLIEEI